MIEKRKYERYNCKIKCKFFYFDGNPDTIDPEVDEKLKGKGLIIDISQGGVCIVTDNKVNIDVPLILKFKLNGAKSEYNARVVRTGLLANNPSEVAQKYSGFASKWDSYIAVEFINPIEEIKSI